MAHHAPRPPSRRPALPGPTTAAPRFRWYRCTTALAALTATAVILTGGATAAYADPTVADIERQIDEDWNRLEPVIERHNATRQDLAAKRRQADALAARIAPLQRQVDEAMERVGRLAARAYKGGQVRVVNTLLGSRSPGEVVEQLGLLDRYAQFQQQDVRQARELRDELAAAKGALDRSITQLAGTEVELGQKRRQIDAEIDRLQRLRLRAYGKGVVDRCARSPVRPVTRAARPGRRSASPAPRSASRTRGAPRAGRVRLLRADPGRVGAWRGGAAAQRGAAAAGHRAGQPRCPAPG